MQQAVSSFPPIRNSDQAAVVAPYCLLVGFEREWSRKYLGVRTFTIISLSGMLSTLIAPPLIFIALIRVISLLVVVNIGALWTHRSLEPTTSGALLVTFALGVLIGQGHVFNQQLRL
jgi:uncharacterized membrane protein YhiD involved in acid resistance